MRKGKKKAADSVVKWDWKRVVWKGKQMAVSKDDQKAVRLEEKRVVSRE